MPVTESIDLSVVVFWAKNIQFTSAEGVYDYIQVEVYLKAGERERFNQTAQEKNWRWHDGRPLILNRDRQIVNLTRQSRKPKAGEEITIQIIYDPTPRDSSVERDGTTDNDAIHCCLS